MKNLISISGKAGHGKDLVGDIIQYLVMKSSNTECKISYDEWITPRGRNTMFLGRDKFVIRKFADKLKDIACILIGCTREQLEDRVFKETPLGEEWCVFKHKIDGRLITPQEMSIQHALHQGLRDDLYEQINLTPRLLLQLLGTECGREILHPNIWVNALFSDYKTYAETKNYTNSTPKDNDYPDWIITDTRFPNELKAIKQRGGITINIIRPGIKVNSTHASETSLDSAEFDYIIINDGDINELIKKVHYVLHKAKII